MLVSAKRKNKKCLMMVENPIGKMQHTRFARRLERELGLTRLRITLCKFTFKPDRYLKPTHIWTNSRLLIHAFENDMFYCTHDAPCGCAHHINVRGGGRSRDAAWFPPEFAAFVARMLSNEARSLAASA